MNRKEFITSAGLLGVSKATSFSLFGLFKRKNNSVPALDHALLAVPNLEEGIQFVKEKTGIEAMAGGKHPNAGTRNALLSLGENRYLEIIAPDPQGKLIQRYEFLSKLKEPILYTWAANTDDMNSVLIKVKASSYENSGIGDGSRITTDGKRLSWKTLALNTIGGPVVPFFIQWGNETIHPSITSPKGCTFQSLELYHPKAAEVAVILRNIGLPSGVKENAKPLIKLTIQTPKGIVTFE